ncbi:MAG: type II secretion system protein GspM [Pseudomonadota bacterium]
MKPQQLREVVRVFWSEREARERRTVSVGAAVVSVILLYMVAFAPALDGSTRLQKDLPQLRQQALALQALSREALAMSANPSAPAVLSTRDSVEAALARRGIKAQSVVVTNDLVRVQLNGVSFAALVEWLDEIQKNARLNLVESRFTAQSQVDIVDATMSLRQPRTDDRP